MQESLNIPLPPDSYTTAPPEVVKVADFRECKSLAANCPPLILQLKGFNRSERLNRQHQQIGNGQAGSSTHRAISPGAVMLIPQLPRDGRLDVTSASAYANVDDSRGMFIPQPGELFFGSVDAIYAWNPSKGNEPVRLTTDASLAFVHSLDMNRDSSRLVVTSSGLDMIVEMNSQNGQVMREWRACEHGYNRTKSSGKLVFVCEPEADPGEDYVVLSKSEMSRLGLPPADRTAFPNGAVYAGGNGDTLLTTMYHHGLSTLDLRCGDTLQIDNSLHHPHSPLRWNDHYIVTNTGQGQALVYDAEFAHRSTIDFSGLPGLDPHSNGREWLQHVQPIGETRLIAVDSNRESLHIIDVADRSRFSVPIHPDWVVQEVRPYA